MVEADFRPKEFLEVREDPLMADHAAELRPPVQQASVGVVNRACSGDVVSQYDGGKASWEWAVESIPDLAWVSPASVGEGNASHVSAENRPTQEKFHCVSCGHLAHADTVGALNVLRAGLVRREAAPA
ncbi:zinc ribbon domain-containing protein [Streptomyces sp. NPDC096013]|uniref:zinc ribbon domain-containing protein n=1 Tax=Streptomyces sp. NPDC096013 TaxID=3366069 RepID=UPI0038308139